MKITRETVEHVARLAALELSSEEIERFTHQLSRILEYIDQLQQLDLEEIPPFRHVLPRREYYREDRPQAGLEGREALSQAPEGEQGLFKVPRVLGGES